MGHERDRPLRANLTPEGTFVIQLRPDSDLEHGRLRGRVEHVVSGDSEPFASLAALLSFIARHVTAAGGAEGQPRMPRQGGSA